METSKIMMDVSEKRHDFGLYPRMYEVFSMMNFDWKRTFSLM